MAQTNGIHAEPPPSIHASKSNLFRRFFARGLNASSPAASPSTLNNGVLGDPLLPTAKPAKFQRVTQRAVPGLPRAQTFKRQQSEQRQHLSPIPTTADERRAISMDRRSLSRWARRKSQVNCEPRTSAPGILSSSYQDGFTSDVPPVPPLPDQAAYYSNDEFLDEKFSVDIPSYDDLSDDYAIQDDISTTDTQSLTTSQYETMLNHELETVWILNLSMHFRDLSKREKFFITYRERSHIWRRVTVSLDYRDAPENSLEYDLARTKFQRDKNARIYDAIRDSLPDIQFYDTVTNLKLETTNGRLHVHVVEDGNEVIHFPSISQFRHLSCRRIRESEIEFDSHMSGFVYKVRVDGRVLVKKEIPSPETVEEFLYEINALSSIRFSNDVIRFYGIVVDDTNEHVKGLLVDYADGGSLADIIYDTCKEAKQSLPWHAKERWARQIIHGLADIHEAGFVQGDFTLSNIVIDDFKDAKIIDINRRGCPVGWEPPEATPLIESGTRISMYIGVKSDLYQLGMVLWALAMDEDEPEFAGRPLALGSETNIPKWYHRITEICLNPDPRFRVQASTLMGMLPKSSHTTYGADNDYGAISVTDGSSVKDYAVDTDPTDGVPHIRAVEPADDWRDGSRTYVDSTFMPYDPFYHVRGRSPTRDWRYNSRRCESMKLLDTNSSWATGKNIRPSYSDIGGDEQSHASFVPEPAITDTTTESAPMVADSQPSHASLQDGVLETPSTPTAQTAPTCAPPRDIEDFTPKPLESISEAPPPVHEQETQGVETQTERQDEEVLVNQLPDTKEDPFVSSVPGETESTLSTNPLDSQDLEATPPDESLVERIPLGEFDGTELRISELSACEDAENKSLKRGTAEMMVESTPDDTAQNEPAVVTTQLPKPNLFEPEVAKQASCGDNHEILDNLLGMEPSVSDTPEVGQAEASIPPKGVDIPLPDSEDEEDESPEDHTTEIPKSTEQTTKSDVSNEGPVTAIQIINTETPAEQPAPTTDLIEKVVTDQGSITSKIELPGLGGSTSPAIPDQVKPIEELEAESVSSIVHGATDRVPTVPAEMNHITSSVNEERCDTREPLDLDTQIRGDALHDDDVQASSSINDSAIDIEESFLPPITTEDNVESATTKIAAPEEASHTETEGKQLLETVNIEEHAPVDAGGASSKVNADVQDLSTHSPIPADHD